MKAIKNIGLLTLGALFLASCAPHLKPHGNHGLPPGQVKKATGAKSAKPYAPGQVKKGGYNNNNGKKVGHGNKNR